MARAARHVLRGRPEYMVALALSTVPQPADALGGLRRIVAWTETRAPVERAWELLARPELWPAWIPGLVWTSGALPVHNEHASFDAVWRGVLLEGRFLARHALSYAHVRLVEPRLGPAFDACVTLSRLPLSQTVVIGEFGVAPWLSEALGAPNPCDDLLGALRVAAARA